MSALFDLPKKRLKERLAETDNQLLSGGFQDFTGAKVLVERRKTLLAAIDILDEQVEDKDEDC